MFLHNTAVLIYYYRSGYKRWKHGGPPKIIMNILAAHLLNFLHLLTLLFDVFVTNNSWFIEIKQKEKFGGQQKKSLRPTGWETLINTMSDYQHILGKILLKMWDRFTRVLTILTCFEAHKSRIDGELITLFCRNVSRIKRISARPEDVRTTFEATDSIWKKIKIRKVFLVDRGTPVFRFLLAQTSV